MYSTLIIMSCPVSAQFFRSSTLCEHSSSALLIMSLLPKSRLSLIWDFARPCWRLWWKGNWHRIDTHIGSIMQTWTTWMQQSILNISKLMFRSCQGCLHPSYNIYLFRVHLLNRVNILWIHHDLVAWFHACSSFDEAIGIFFWQGCRWYLRCNSVNCGIKLE